MSAIAQLAGVGKQTLYRWWPSKEAVLAEALTQRAHALAPVPDTGSVRDDLATFLADTFLGASRPDNSRVLRQIMSGAQQDPHLAQAVSEFTAARRDEMRTLLERAQRRGELPENTNIDILLDQAYGVLWYRLLVGHAPLDQQSASELADNLIAAAMRR